MSKSANVKVYCRIRPENEKEKQSGMKTCISPISDNSVKILTEAIGIDTGKDSKNKSESSQTFTFDSVFSSETSQETIFNIVAKPLINSALEGINGTIFCYGQTSSGKTYTMEGIHNDPNLMGVIPRMMEYIFMIIEKANSEIEYSVKCQYYQIYNEKIQDLLDIRKKDLAIREDKNKGIWVEDCTEAYVSSEEEMYAVFKEGSNNRTVSATNMNKGSSRSHSLFVVTLFQRNTITGSSKTGRIYFVDLAGSEKMSKTGIEGGTGLKEAQNINKSLMTLGMVINSLTEGAKHIPYRDSKLTRVLQESLGGNSMTNLVITCSPNFMNQSETLSTLRFGQRAKLIKNKVVANTQQSVKELMIKLKKAEEKIAMLEKIIEGKGGDLNIDLKNIDINDKNIKCEQCKVIAGQLNYVKNELLNSQNENEELIKYKEELCDEIKNKNNEIVKLNDIIRNNQLQLEEFREENDSYFDEIKKYMDLITDKNKELEKAIKDKDIFNAEKIFNSCQKINDELIEKLGLFMNNLEDKSSKDNNLSIYSKSENKENNKSKINNRAESNVNNKTVIIHKSDSININNEDSEGNEDDESINNVLNNTFCKLNRKNINLDSDFSDSHQKLNKSFLITTIKNKCLIPLAKNKTKNKNKGNNKINLSHSQTEEEDEKDPVKKDLKGTRKENEELKKKKVELECIIKSLNEKIYEKDQKLEEYKEKSIKDLMFKEEKIQNLANLIGDLEDENYRLKHFSKENMTKARIIMMEKQITTFAQEFQKKDEKNKYLEKKFKQQEEQINKLSKENKMLQNNIEFLSKNLSRVGGVNSDAVKRSSRNFRRNTFFENSFMDSENFLDQSYKLQANKMMKFIKGGTKTNGGFLSKFMDNDNINKQDTMKFINAFKGQAMNNKDFQMEQMENQLKQLDKDILNTTHSEFG